eukprot:Phypoly_transcript_03876.p1 GENE.Phypoly_transcript_03876~~Phypoly_transcript_03876.p1  ORF type:complete len:539 (+),score=127.88 Phypoly_transcript_03876:244-1860(+)
MQHFIYPAPLPPPLPPSGGRGTILSQEARLHALQIAEEIQAERGSYRKWNEVAKAVNRQYGSNVDGDLVKRQVTSMLRSVQRSGLNSVKRPRKHAEVIQQLLDPVVPKRQCVPVAMLPPGSAPLRIRGTGEEGEGDEVAVDAEGRPVITVETNDSDHESNTGSEGGSPATGADAHTLPGGEKIDLTVPNTTTTTATTTSTSDATLLPIGETAPTTTSPTPTKSTTGEGSATKSDGKKSALLDGESHSIERVPRKRSEKHSQGSVQPLSLHPIMMQPTIFAPPPPRILPTMTVEEVYNLIMRLHPDVDAEFVRNQEIDGAAFQTLTHKELTDFGVNTFGKRNKLLQLCLSFDAQSVPAPGNPQDFFYGRVPAFSTASPFIDAKLEGDRHDKELSEKKPPVTKVLDMEVVGVRKRYLVERENGGIEVLTPCKLRKYKHLTAAFEHIHPDKLVPIPTFSQAFTHVPSSNAGATPEDPSKPPSTPADPATATATTSPPSRKSKGTAGHIAPTAAYYPMYYPPPGSYSVMSSTPSGNLQQWTS